MQPPLPLRHPSKLWAEPIMPPATVGTTKLSSCEAYLSSQTRRRTCQPGILCSKEDRDFYRVSPSWSSRGAVLRSFPGLEFLELRHGHAHKIAGQPAALNSFARSVDACDISRLSSCRGGRSARKPPYTGEQRRQRRWGQCL